MEIRSNPKEPWQRIEINNCLIAPAPLIHPLLLNVLISEGSESFPPVVVLPPLGMPEAFGSLIPAGVWVLLSLAKPRLGDLGGLCEHLLRPELREFLCDGSGEEREIPRKLPATSSVPWRTPPTSDHTLTLRQRDWFFLLVQKDEKFLLFFFFPQVFHFLNCQYFVGFFLPGNLV